MAQRRMLTQHPGEFGKAARILVLVRLPGRAVGIPRRGRRETEFLKHLRGLARDGAPLLDQHRIGARTVTASGGRDADAAPRIMDADVQRGRGAHRMADNMRLVDAERIHDCDDVVAGNVLAVALWIGRHIGWWIAALAVGDAAGPPREIAHTRLPRS